MPVLGLLILIGLAAFTSLGIITSIYKALVWGFVVLLIVAYLGWWSFIPLGLLLLGAIHAHGKKVAA